eukprot:3709509-Rhodomonas_salina.1
MHARESDSSLFGNSGYRTSSNQTQLKTVTVNTAGVTRQRGSESDGRGVDSSDSLRGGVEVGGGGDRGQLRVRGPA